MPATLDVAGVNGPATTADVAGVNGPATTADVAGVNGPATTADVAGVNGPATTADVAGVNGPATTADVAHSCKSPIRARASEHREQMAELFALRRLGAAIGNNVNQLARKANVGDGFPAEAAPVLDQIRRLMVRIDATLNKLAGSR